MKGTLISLGKGLRVVLVFLLIGFVQIAVIYPRTIDAKGNESYDALSTEETRAVDTESFIKKYYSLIQVEGTDIYLSSVNLEVPSGLKTKLAEYIEEKYPKIKRVAITHLELYESWAAISLVLIDSPDFNINQVGAGESGISLLGIIENGDWKLDRYGDENFKRDLASVSTESAKSYGESSLLLSTPNYKWPWASGLSWGYWQSQHDCTPSSCALDLGTTGSDKRVLASESGNISFICDTGTYSINVRIEHDNGNAIFEYFHIDKYTRTSAVRMYNTVSQGQVLGSVKPDTWEDNCGNTDQNSISAHVHLLIPKNTNFVIDGWNVNTGNGYLEYNGQQYFPDLSVFPLTSTNTPVDNGPACGGANVVISNTTIFNGQTINCYATNSITISPETTFQTGAEFRAAIQ